MNVRLRQAVIAADMRGDRACHAPVGSARVVELARVRVVLSPGDRL
jgi:hypothetical protein